MLHSDTSKVRYFCKFFIPVVSIVLLGSVILYQIQFPKKQEALIRDRQINSLVHNQEHIQHILDAVITDLLNLVAFSEMRVRFDGGLVIDKQLTTEFLAFSQYKGIYDKVRVLDRQGMELLRVNKNNDKSYLVSPDQLQNKGDRNYFLETIGLKKGEVFMSPFDLNIEHGKIDHPLKPVIRFGTPLIDSQRQTQGIIVVNYLGAQLLDSVASFAQESYGQIMLLNPDGYWLKSVSPGDEWGFMYEDRQHLTFAQRYPVEWQEISLTDAGQFSNAKGFFTFATIYPYRSGPEQLANKLADPANGSIRSSKPKGWKIVSYVPAKEIRQGHKTFLLIMAGANSVVLGVLGIVLWKLTLTTFKRRRAEEGLHQANDQLNEINNDLQQEIAEHKKIAERLLVATDIICRSPAVAFRWANDPHLSVEYVSKNVEAVLGFSPDDFVTEKLAYTDIIYAKDLDRVIAEFVRSSEDSNIENIVHQPYRIITKNGERIWVSGHTHIARDTTGQVLSYEGVLLDITDRELAGTALRRSEVHLKKILATSNEGFWFINNELITTEVNRALCEILARPADEIVGKSVYDFVDEDNRNIFEDQLAKRRQGADGAYEIALCRPDKSNVSCLFNATPFFNEKGLKTGSFAMVTDITDRVKYEKDLHEAKRNAENANEAKSVFLSSMSHELRTPLNSVLGFAQLLDVDEPNRLDTDQKNYVQKILRSGKHLLHLIDEVLDLAKIESGGLELSMEPVNIYTVVADIIDIVKPLSELKHIKIFLDGTDRSMFIHADLTRFRQVILNLLSNAVKYNRSEGEVRISYEEQEGNKIRLTVADTGPGIEKNKLERLFKPFDRLGVEASSIEGTGIGLTITKRLVEFMGGSIDLNSELGKGTNFFIDLPQADAPPEKRAILYKQNKLPPGTIGGEYTLLYVEDNILDRQLLEAILESTPNLKLITAEDAESGIDMTIHHKPDLILMDLNLPGMDGFEALEKLKEFKETKGTPVVALSSNAMPLDIEKAIASGFVEYLTKPFNISRLYQVVGDVLRHVPEKNP